MRKYISKLRFYDLWSLLTISITLIIVFILCLLISIPRIENSLQKRSSLGLSAVGNHFTKVKVSFSGRDANLDGSVTSEGLTRLAHTLIGKVWGVRVVKSKLQISKTCPLTAKHNLALQTELDALADKYPKVDFDKDGTNPSKELIGYLQLVARAIKRYEPMSIIIVGTNDSISANYNLFSARALIVRDLLVERGLSVRCLNVLEKGKEQPLINTEISKGHYIKFLLEELK